MSSTDKESTSTIEKRKVSPTNITAEAQERQGTPPKGRPLPDIVGSPQDMMMGTTTGTTTPSPGRSTLAKSFTGKAEKKRLDGQQAAALRKLENREYSNEEAAEAYAKQNVEIRELFYSNDNKPNNMLNFLMNAYTINDKTCVQHMIDRFDVTEKLTEVSMPKPGSKTFTRKAADGATMKSLTKGATRTAAETAMCYKKELQVSESAVEIQGNYSIGAWEVTPAEQEAEYKNGTRVCQEVYEDENFNQWEKMNCWLCGLPLSFNVDSKTSVYPRQAISCEHKQAVGSMILHEAGIQTAIPRGTLERIKSNVNTPLRIGKGKRYGDSEIHPSWKEIVRSEGYGWAHDWCNMKKNQAPMFTVRHYPETRKEDDVDVETGKTKIVYQMEINNIYHFVKDLFNLDPEVDFLEGSEIDFTPGVDEYVFNRKDSNKKPDPIRLWVENIVVDKNNPSKGDEERVKDFKKNQALKAFKNMIKMLIPSYYLLNCGNDVSDEIKRERTELLGDRTMFEGIDELSIIDRFKDNFMRLVNALPSKAGQILAIIKDIEGGSKTKSLPKIISTLFSCLDSKRMGLNDEDSRLQKDIETQLHEFFNALNKLQNLTNIEGEQIDDGMALTRRYTFSTTATTPLQVVDDAVSQLRQITNHGLSTVQEDEDGEEEGGLKRSSSLTSSVGEVEPDASQNYNSSLEATLLFEEGSQTGGKRKKTRRKRRRKKKKTRKRIYFKDLLDDPVQSGGLIPRRIYFNDLL